MSTIGSLTLTVASLLAVTPSALNACDLELPSQSDKWQVRYGVATQLRVSDTNARAILERLALDPDRRVARQAFAVYSSRFVDVEESIAKEAFDRGDFDVIGVNPRNYPADFRTAEFWLVEMRGAESDSSKARAIRALGLLQSKVSLEEFRMVETQNPYLLAQLAVASRRLGDDSDYLTRFDEILALPVDEAIYYQSFVVDAFIQTHPELARPTWERIENSLSSHPDLQSNWVYGHAIQEARLP